MAENKKDIIKSAQLYFQEGKWDKAILEYKKLLALDPTDYGTHNMLGDAYKKKGEDAAAYAEYMTAAEAYAKQGMADRSQMLFKKIAMLDSGKLINEADRQKQILIKKNVIAEKLIDEGKADEAIATYREILQINPAQFDVYQKLGELYFQKGDKEEAMAHYKKIVEVYYKNKLFKKALPIYQKMMEMDPDNISNREKIAEILEKENDEQGAKREYLFLVQYYWDHKDIEKTDLYADKAVAFKSIEAKFFKGAALYMKKDFPAAIKELDMLLKFKANHQQALQLMASINIETGKDDEAMKFLDRLFKADPESAMANETMAELHFKKNETKDAHAKLLAAAVLYMKKQEYQKAAMAVEKITAKDPENIEAFEKLAEIHRNSGKKKEGADAYLKISGIFKNKGNEAKSEEYFKIARDLFPAHPAVLERSKKISADTPPPAPAPVSFMSAAKPAAPKLPEPAAPAKPAASAAPAAKPAEPKLPEPAQPKSAGPKLPEPAAPKAPAQGIVPPAPPPAPAPTSKITDNFVPPPSMIKAAAAAAPAPAAQPKAPEKPAAESPKASALPEIELMEPKLSPPKPPEKAPVPQGKLNFTSTLDQIMAGPRETVKPPPVKSPGESAKEDVIALVAMADNYMKTGSFDEAIEMYQKASALDPHNSSIKEKLTKAYSQFAGTGLTEITEQEEAKKVAELKKRAEEEAKKKAAEEERKKEDDRKLREFEEARKKAEEEKKKTEASKKSADEEAAKKAADTAKKAEEDAKKKADEDAKRKTDEEAKKKAEEQKKKEEADKKKKSDEGDALDIEISDDFATVTTAEIFMAQGLYSEADKILTKILKKEPGNVEAKMMLNQIKKMEEETEATGHNVKDDEEPPPAGGKHSKVSYI